MAKKDETGINRLNDLTPINKKKKKAPQKKGTRKPVTYTLDEDTITLIKRIVYWDRKSSASALVEEAILALAQGKEYEPIPGEEKEG